MRKGTCIALCFMLLSIFCIDVNAQDTLNKTLSNGLKVTIVKTKYAQYAQLAMVYQAGFGNENIENAGAARVVFEAFDGKTKNSKDYYQEAVAKIYGHSSKLLNSRFALFQLEVPFRNLEKAIALEAERMYNLELSKDWLRKCYTKSLLSKQLEQSTFTQAYLNTFNKAGLQDGHELIEKEVYAPVDEITADAYYKQYFSPLRTQLTIVSSIDPSTVFLIVERYFKSIAKENYPSAKNEIRVGLKENFNPPKLQLPNYKTLVWANPFPASNDTLNVCYYYLSKTLTDGQLSFLPNRLRENGIACIQAFNIQYSHTLYQHWAIQGLMVREKEYAKSAEIINAAFGELLYKGILQDDIDNFIKGLHTHQLKIAANNKLLATQIAIESFEATDMAVFTLKHAGLLTPENLRKAIRTFYIPPYTLKING